jgi:cAMP-dependent protein kinase regulator
MDLDELLLRNPHTAALGPADRSALAAAMVVRSHPDGHVLIQEGRRGDTLFLLLEGEVLVTREGTGAQSIKRLQPGELFGLIALIDSEPRSATCTAAGPVRVAGLTSGAFALLFNAHAPIAEALQRTLAAQLTHDFRNLNRQIREELSRT